MSLGYKLGLCMSTCICTNMLCVCRARCAYLHQHPHYKLMKRDNGVYVALKSLSTAQPSTAMILVLPQMVIYDWCEHFKLVGSMKCFYKDSKEFKGMVQNGMD